MKRPTILFGVLLSLLSLLAFAPTTHAASVFPSNPLGYAYGVYITTPTSASGTSAGPLLGPTALAYIGCSQATSATNSNNGVSEGSYITSGQNQSQVTANRSATSSNVQAVSTVQNINLLNGLITADQVRAVATSQASSVGATSADGGSTFSNLVVAGKPISGALKPNTVISLPGFGSATLNERSGPSNGTNSTSYAVTMIDVKISLTNKLGIPAGAQIVVAHATSSDVSTVQPVYVSAHSYRLSATGLTNASSTSIDSLAPAQISCTGGNSEVATTSTLTSPVGSTGATTNIASGKNTSNGSAAASNTNIANVNLLKGLITASNVQAHALAVWNGTGTGSSSATLTDLKVDGIPISSSVAPDTLIPIPTLGYVIVNEQSNINSISKGLGDVNALDIRVTSDGYGLKSGARIILGHADALALSY